MTEADLRTTETALVGILEDARAALARRRLSDIADSTELVQIEESAQAELAGLERIRTELKGEPTAVRLEALKIGRASPPRG